MPLSHAQAFELIKMAAVVVCFLFVLGKIVVKVLWQPHKIWITSAFNYKSRAEKTKQFLFKYRLLLCAQPL